MVPCPQLCCCPFHSLGPSRAVVGKDTILALGVDGHQMRYVATKRTWKSDDLKNTSKCCSPQLAPCASIVKTPQVKGSEEPVIPWYKLGVIFKIPMDFQLVNCPLHLVDLLTNWRPVFLSEVWDVQASKRAEQRTKSTIFFDGNILWIQLTLRISILFHARTTWDNVHHKLHARDP